MTHDVLGRDAHGQAAAVRSGELSARELVAAAIDAAQRLDPEIGAIIHPRFERALARFQADHPEAQVEVSYRAFMLALVMIFVLWVVHNLPDRTDINWLLKGGGIFGGGHPPAKKFNAGQKMIFWSVVVLGASISASGLDASK